MSSSQHGGGYGSVEKTGFAGHSATAGWTSQQTQSDEGSFSQTITDNDVDSDEFSSVGVSGTTRITGSVNGGDDGEVTSTAAIWAEADEIGTDFWVRTMLVTDIAASAGEGVTAKGTASVSGSAAATSIWNLAPGAGTISASGAGTVSSSLTAKGTALYDAAGTTESEIYSEITTPSDGTPGGSYASLGCSGLVTSGTVKIKSDASGTATVSTGIQGAAGDDYTGYGLVDGKTSGSLDVKNADEIPDPGMDRHVDSVIFVTDDWPHDFVGAVLDCQGKLTAGDEAFSGSSSSSAKGTAIIRDRMTDSASMLFNTFNSVEGTVSTSGSQRGTGSSEIDGSIISYPSYVLNSIYVDYPVVSDTVDGIGERFSEVTFHGIVTQSYLNTAMELTGAGDSFSGSGKTSVSGTALATTGSMYVTPGSTITGGLSNAAEGSISSSTAATGGGTSDVESQIVAMAALGPPSSTQFRVTDPDGSYPLDFEYDHLGTTATVLDAETTAEGLAGDASTSVRGSASAGSAGMYTMTNLVDETYQYSASSLSTGKVTSAAETGHECAEAASTSVLFGLSATGLATDDFPGTDFSEFCAAQHGLLSSSAVWNPFPGSTGAEGTASGDVRTAGIVDLVHVSGLPTDLWHIESSGSGTGSLASGITARDGYGISQSWVNGGTIAGLEETTGDAVLYKFGEPIWDGGIYTTTQGEGLSDDSSVKGSATAKKAVSTDFGHIDHSIWDPTPAPGDWDPDYSLEFTSRLADPAKSELKVKGVGDGGAGTSYSVFSYWGYDPSTYLAFGTIGVMINADATGTGDVTSKASAKPIDLYFGYKLTSPVQTIEDYELVSGISVSDKYP